MHFYHNYLNTIVSEDSFISKMRGGVSGASVVSGTLTPIFSQRHIWAVSNSKATVTMQQHILVATEGTRANNAGKATVSGTLTPA